MIKNCIKTLLFLTLITTTSSFTAFAQTAQNNNKMVKGDMSTEIIVNPFSGGVSLNNNMQGGLKYRYFFTDKTALRVSGLINTLNQTDKYNNPLTGADDGELTRMSNLFLIMPGVEWHMTGTEKLSPYIGIDAGVGYLSQTETLKNIDESQRYQEDYGRERTASSLSYNLNLVFGADYYIAQKVFLGGEFGLRTSYSQVLEAKTTYTGTAVTTVMPLRVTPDASFSISTLAVSGLRLGIIF